MDDVFTAADFDIAFMHAAGPMVCLDVAVARSNAKIARLLGPEVFWCANSPERGYIYSERHPNDTHRAVLFDVREIERKGPCEHIPNYQNIAGSFSRCVKCDAKIVAKWEVAE